MKKKNAILLIASIVLTELVGFTSSLFSGDVRESYAMMVKPPLSPPNWIFGIVWSILYLLMGIAFYLIITSVVDHLHKKDKMLSITLYILQLMVNFIWSIIFFGNNMLWVALLVIIVLDFLVVQCILVFKRINKIAALLLIPYLLWISFATYLNLAFAILN